MVPEFKPFQLAVILVVIGHRGVGASEIDTEAGIAQIHLCADSVVRQPGVAVGGIVYHKESTLLLCLRQQAHPLEREIRLIYLIFIRVVGHTVISSNKER